MTARARDLFDRYVLGSLNHPDLASLSIGTHVFNLNGEARQASIPAAEMIDELEPLSQALTSAKK